MAVVLVVEAQVVVGSDDARNVLNEFKGVAHDAIVAQLDERGVDLEIAIENLKRDFNMGTIVRSANAFGVRTVHIIGSKQWNKRGAMMTDKYLTMQYHSSIEEFQKEMTASSREIICIDNVAGSVPLASVLLPISCVLVFGAEGPGLSSEMLAAGTKTIAIEQLGSTRSINVGVAAGIVMYEWLRQHKLL